MTPEEMKTACIELYGPTAWQGDFAEDIGYSITTISHWYTGKHQIPPLVPALLKLKLHVKRGKPEGDLTLLTLTKKDITMSQETVLNKCLQGNPDADVEVLKKDIKKISERFERMVKTSFNEGHKGMFVAMYPESPTTAKNTHFAKFRMEYIHQFLEIFIDMYDYQPKNKKDQ